MHGLGIPTGQAPLGARAQGGREREVRGHAVQRGTHVGEMAVRLAQRERAEEQRRLLVPVGPGEVGAQSVRQAHAGPLQCLGRGHRQRLQELGVLGRHVRARPDTVRSEPLARQAT